MTKSITHRTQFVYRRIELIGFAFEHRPVNSCRPIRSKHTFDLVERKTCGSTQPNQGESLRHTAIKQSSKPLSAD